MKNIYFILLIFLLFAFDIQAADIQVSDNGSGTGTVTWTKNNTYILNGFVFVNDGQTLTIEAGTVVKGKPGQGANASALVVARGGKIMAQGSASEPIIFTGESDDTNSPTDVAENTTGLWGGVIILGKASLNSTPGETQIEGIPSTEPRGLYGGTAGNTDDEDDSGVFSYCSIRHGGTDIGAGNEINGLTLGGVGSGTTIDHVEIIFNADDGIEFFGGTVNVSHAVVAFQKDDAFDYDEGWRGKGQFWFVIQSDGADSDRGGEHDGGTDPENATPYATPTIYNVTYIGRGEAAGKRAITFRDNAGGFYYNSIFTEYGSGVDIELLGNGTQHTYKQWQDGNLKIENNIFWNIAGNTAANVFNVSAGKYGVTTASDPVQAAADSTAAVDAAKATYKASFATANNAVVNPGLKSVGRVFGGNMLDPTPTSAEVSMNLAAYPSDPFFKPVTYKGAFSPASGDAWVKGWTALDEYQYLTLTVGIDKKALAQAIEVAPNPSTGVFAIKMSDISAPTVDLTLFDIMGKEVLRIQAPVSGGILNTTLDANSLPTGIYTLKAQTGSEVIGIERLVKN